MFGYFQILLVWPSRLYLRLGDRQFESPNNAQHRVLRQIVEDLAQTEYGRHLGINGHEGLEDFRRKVPIADYSELSPWVEAQKKSDEPILSPSRISLYEKTSGSSGRAKYIPYSPRLRATFARMALTWIADILANGPRFRSGKTLISVSPAFAEEGKTESGVQIGLEDDADYLPGVLGFFLKKFLVVPSGMKRLKNPADYRFVLSLVLLSEENLEAISIWNPTYLTALLRFTVTHRQEMKFALLSGRVKRGGYSFSFKPISRARFKQIELMGQDSDWTVIWPRLKFISCWTDAGAKTFAEEIARNFPGVLIQSKGLLSTESPMTVPRFGASFGVPLIADVFFEFLDSRGQIKLLQELEDGARYEIIVSPLGGFARYRIGDHVEVSGRFGKTPCLKFIGRAEQVSDLVGEKLNENFVATALARFSTRFQFLIPVLVERPPYYCLVTSEDDSERLQNELDEALSLAYHYGYARKLEQLGKVQIVSVENPEEAYSAAFEKRGVKWGDLKYTSLVVNADDAAAIASRLPMLRRTTQNSSKEARPRPRETTDSNLHPY